MYIDDLKFSLWADFIERDFIDHGLKELIDRGVVNGATSNPAIFKNAILTSPAYKDQLLELKDLPAKARYEALAIYDIQKAADQLRPLLEKGDDGYVSIEVDPYLCDDAAATIEEGKRLFDSIARPNVMIKVPATEAGYEAMEALAAEGIAVNATLVFSEQQAVLSAEAFERAQDKSGVVVNTVISVFVSRIDRAIDDVLEESGVTPSLSGIYNAAAIYNAVEAKEVLKCRTLFASTGVKGDTLPASYYVDGLLAYNSINTAPIATIDAFITGADKAPKLPIKEEVIRQHFEAVAAAGIDFEAVVQKQIDDGLTAFKDAFSDILRTLEK